MLTDLLDKLLTVETQNATVDDAGGLIENWSTRLANVPCSVWPVSAKNARIVEEYQRRDIDVRFECCTATDIQPTTKDRVLIEGSYYIVCGYMPYINRAFSDETPFIMLLGLRNQGK